MRAALFGLSFAAACLLSLVDPAIGVYAYMVNYIVAPQDQWWGAPLAGLGARFSLTLSLCIALGMVLRWGKLERHGPLLHLQEKLIWAFVVVMIASRVWGVPIDDSLKSLSGTSESPAEKMPKVALFLFMLTNTCSKYKNINIILWILILAGGLYTGYDGYTATPGRFVKGRLDAIGGIDFRESSQAAAHLIMVGVIAGIYFLKTPNWKAKTICLVSGAFTVNAVIMTQTRAAMIGLAVCMPFALLWAPRKHRITIAAYLVLGIIGFFSLTNKTFWSRAETISDAAEKDDSATSRLDLWNAGIQMGLEHPLGVGAGSYYSVIGSYNARYRGRDCHNTYIRCFAELGVPGTLLFAAVIINAFLMLRRIPRLAEGTPIARDIELDCYGLRVALVAYLTAGIFMGLTYIEELWWFLSLPVCLERAAIGAGRDLATVQCPTSGP
jgi:hypothetical protein